MGGQRRVSSGSDISSPSSPFHSGEIALQQRVGVRDQVESLGKRVIRDHLTEEHRQFFVQLPTLVVGSRDSSGRLWASLLSGQPAFMSSPDPQQLDVAARPIPGDPLNASLKVGARLGMLGIQFHTRRRNRGSARVVTMSDEGFSLSIDQTFGNCPQYIQGREPVFVDTVPGDAQAYEKLTEADHQLIRQADTFFIASGIEGDDDDPSAGQDVSHRGGNPGFVKVEGNELIWPDFVGNFHFNTLGNLEIDPRAGLIFMDFETGDTLQLTGRAEVLWDADEQKHFKGAERMLRFVTESAVRIPHAMPMRWQFNEASPVNKTTGSWEEVAERQAAEAKQNEWQSVRVARVHDESETVRSIIFETPETPLSHKPGQFLPLRLDIPGQSKPVDRTYTLTNAPDEPLRISVKRESKGLASNYIHQLKAGDSLQVRAPRGHFQLQPGLRPILMLSAGVGITPMIAMLEALLSEHPRKLGSRPVYFVHGARNGSEYPFKARLAELNATQEWLQVITAFSQTRPEDKAGVDFQASGHVKLGWVKSLLPLDDYEVYLCGPDVFMQSIYRELRQLGIRKERIHYEFFAGARPLEPEDDLPAVSTDKVKVSFSKTGKEAIWEPDSGSLLELAEAIGLQPEYGCRSGACGQCAAKVKEGQVTYSEQPASDAEEGCALLCRAKPAQNQNALDIVI